MPNNIAEIILRVTTEGSENAQTLAGQFSQLDQIGKQVASSMTSAAIAQRNCTTELARSHSQLTALIQQWANLDGQVDHFAARTLQGFSSASARVFTQMIEGSKNASEAFRQFAQEVIEQILQMTIQWLIAQTIMAPLGFLSNGGSVTSPAFAGLGPVGSFPAGGPVFGPGTETSDSIPAWLSHNEFVQPAASHRYYGTDAMEALRTRSIPRERIREAMSGHTLSAGGPTLPMRGFAEGGIAVRLAGGGVAFRPTMSFTTPPVIIGDEAMAAWLATSAGQRALDAHLASRTGKIARRVQRAGGHRQE